VPKGILRKIIREDLDMSLEDFLELIPTSRENKTLGCIESAEVQHQWDLTRIFSGPRKPAQAATCTPARAREAPELASMPSPSRVPVFLVQNPQKPFISKIS
jgi:hypothetical protein